MKKFSANTLDAALIEATKYFNCSLTQIEYEIVQNPSGGFLGFLKKDAIIVATKKHNIDIVKEKTYTSAAPTIENTQDGLFEANAATSSCTQTETNINKPILDIATTSMDSKSVSQVISKVDSSIDVSCENCAKPLNDKNLSGNICSENAEVINQTMITNQESISGETNNNFNSSHVNISTKSLGDKEESQDKTSIKYCEDKIAAKNLNTNLESDVINSKHVETFVQQDKAQSNSPVLHKKSIDEKMQGDFDSTFYDQDSNIAWQDAVPSSMQQKKGIESICKEVQDELVELLSYLPLKLNKVHVEPYDDHTLFILIDGFDAALLIGQKGYRYKSLSYLLFNWIHTCYGYGVRLEIAQFLKNQEEIMKSYLEPIIENAKINGKAQTKPLDGVLTHIALKMLRDALPNKYVVFRENADGEKYISISEFVSNGNMRSSVHGFGNFPKY